MENAAVALENNLAFPQNLKTELQYDPAISFIDLHSREWKTYVYKNLAHKCSQQHYSEQSKSRNNPNVHLLMNK